MKFSNLPLRWTHDHPASQYNLNSKPAPYYYLHMSESIMKLKNLLDNDCKIEKIYPEVFASDAETNIVTVELRCQDGQLHKIRAYRDDAKAVREFLRTRKL